MPIELTIRVDISGVLGTMQALSSPRLERAAAAALNDTAKNAQVQAVKSAAPKLGLPSRDVKAAMSITSATTGHLEAAIIASGRPIPLIRFKPKDRRGVGVSVRIAGKTDVFRHAFIATMKSGYRAVWERVGTARGPVKQLYGPSIPGIMAREDVRTAVAETIDKQLGKNLKRETNRQLRAARGLAGSKNVG